MNVRILLALSALIVFFTNAHAYAGGATQDAMDWHSLNQAQIEALISQKTPPGMSRKTVVKELSEWGVPFSDEPPNGADIRVLFRDIRQEGGPYVTTKSLQIQFHFSVDGHLASTRVTPLYTGP